MNDPYSFDITAVERRCITCGQPTGSQSFWLNGLGPYCHVCWAKTAALFPPLGTAPSCWPGPENPGVLSSPIPDIQQIVQAELERQLKPYLLCAETITAAAQSLVAKLDQVSDSAEFKGVFGMAAIHGCPYQGPQFGPELETLRAALAGTIQSSTTTNESPRSDP